MKIKLSILVTLIFLSFTFLFLKLSKKESSPTQTHNLAGSIMENVYVSPISINYLRGLEIDSPALTIEEELDPGTNYKRYIASYQSEGNKVYGLLTIPIDEMPEGGFPAIVFNHGYIPPSQYQTEFGYVAYVDYLARNGFVVFKIDYRGNGKSEGDPSGSYFSSAYTIDAISALKSLQKLSDVNPDRIGMWGHSMAGNLLLRAMLITDQIKAGVIWAGAVYSYEDFVKYGISDSSYVHRPSESKEGEDQRGREISPEIQKIRSTEEPPDFSDPFWSSISLTKNINYLDYPIQLHHSAQDLTVNIGYSADLVEVLKQNGKKYEFYEYDGGGHNINSPYFETAMERTVTFFKKYL